MSGKHILLFRDGEERRIPLDKEKLIVGRDAGCDVVLADSNVSRKHAAITARYGAVYIENISPTGQVLRGGEAVEYGEMNEGDEYTIGPFTLQWRSGAVAAPVREVEAAPAEAAPADGAFAALAVGDAPEMPALEAPEPSAEPEVQEASVEGDSSPDMPPPADSNFEAVGGDDKTQVASQGIRPLLRVAQGERIGREIYLENGLSWIVGRSAKCHIQIDSHKLSRQHFKIIRIGNAFRIEDLGSANGTRVNGVAVTDAPLHAFDTIQVGPVELQFLIANSQVQPGALAALPAPTNGSTGEIQNNAASFGLEGDSNGGGAEKTLFAAPVPYDPALATGGSDSTQIREMPMGSTPHPTGGVFASAAPGKSDPLASVKARFEAAKEWYLAQPKNKRILYGGAVAMLALCLAVGLMPNDKTAPVAVATPESQRTPASDPNAGDAQWIDPKFKMLSTEDQNRIRDLYAKAEESQKKQDWPTAFKAVQEVLKYVDRYKRSGEIMQEAQRNLNEEAVGSLSKSLSNINDAARDVQEQLALLLAAGEKAIEEGRWADAEENYTKALNLDPSSDKASQGLAAAVKRDRKAFTTVPAAPPPPPDPDAEVRQAERDAIDSLKKQYQDVRARMKEGSFRSGLPVLKDLERKVDDKIADYSSGGGRVPASLSADFGNEAKALREKVHEAIDAVKAQLRADFQTQLADAEQFEQNKQYAQARETYDRVLEAAPGFEEARESRGRLYIKIVAEARNLYQESLIYESVGDLDNAVDGYQRTRELLTNVEDSTALEYFRRSTSKLRKLAR